VLNKTGDSGQPCFNPDFRGNADNFSSFSIMLAVGLSHIAFITLRYDPSIAGFSRDFIMKGC
jgi:hypothetical protein